MTLKPGDTVRSAKVNRAPAFVGTIAEVVRERKQGDTVFYGYYLVRDARGGLWHRNANELSREAA